MQLAKSVAAFALLCAAVSALEDSELCLPKCNDAGTECVFKPGINIFAGETGYFEFEGCKGVNPTLGVKAGVKHIFDQSNVTNWFHPLGFAYGPDGDYLKNVEMEPMVPDPTGEQVCNETAFCQHPQYKLNGENLCTDCDDPEDFGLDEYEEVWFHGGRDAWIDVGNFSVEITITDPATTEFFMFCHIHNKMSFRVKVLDENGHQRNKEDITQIPYVYNTISEFDSHCGTFNVTQFQKSEGACDGLTFLCGDDEHSRYGQCMNAIDCAMHEEMRTSYLHKDPVTTFMHQMIAHHRNAVNMAKILLKYNPPSLRCGTDYDGRRRLQVDEEYCHEGNPKKNAPAETLLWEIINGQNAQITFMRAWLEDNMQPAFDYCPARPPFTKPVIGAVVGMTGLTVMSLGGVFFLMYKRKTVPLQEEDVKPAKTIAATNDGTTKPAEL